MTRKVGRTSLTTALNERAGTPSPGFVRLDGMPMASGRTSLSGPEVRSDRYEHDANAGKHKAEPLGGPQPFTQCHAGEQDGYPGV